MSLQIFVGTWRFVSCIARTSTGQIDHPWGKDSIGYLTYTADGYVFVSRMSASILSLSGEVESNAAAIVENFEAYVGRYETTSDTVTHAIEICSSPEFVGTKQVRFFAFHGDELHLTTAPVIFDGITHTASLVWRRAAAV
jgi:Lipocalin-like domain